MSLTANNAVMSLQQLAIQNTTHDLEQKDDEMKYIETLIKRLEDFERSNASNGDVQKALEITDRQLQPYKEILVGNDFLAIYHGSLQYRDPRNLDIDIIFFTESETERLRLRKIQLQIQGDFESLDNWPNVGRNNGHCDTNFITYSLGQIKDAIEYCQAHGIRLPYEELDIDPDAAVSYILTSKLIYPEQTDLFDKFKLVAHQLLREYPVLRIAVIEELENTLDIRALRRLI